MTNLPSRQLTIDHDLNYNNKSISGVKDLSILDADGVLSVKLSVLSNGSLAYSYNGGSVSPIVDNTGAVIGGGGGGGGGGTGGHASADIDLFQGFTVVRAPKATPAIITAGTSFTDTAAHFNLSTPYSIDTATDYLKYTVSSVDHYKKITTVTNDTALYIATSIDSDIPSGTTYSIVRPIQYNIVNTNPLLDSYGGDGGKVFINNPILTNAGQIDCSGISTNGTISIYSAVSTVTINSGSDGTLLTVSDTGILLNAAGNGPNVINLTLGGDSTATASIVNWHFKKWAGSHDMHFPTDDGTPGQVLSTNGSGVLTWVTPISGSGSGTTTGIQNSSGSYGKFLVPSADSGASVTIPHVRTLAAGTGISLTYVNNSGTELLNEGSSAVAIMITNTQGITPVDLNMNGNSSTYGARIYGIGTTGASQNGFQSVGTTTHGANDSRGFYATNLVYGYKAVDCLRGYYSTGCIVNYEAANIIDVGIGYNAVGSRNDWGIGFQADGVLTGYSAQPNVKYPIIIPTRTNLTKAEAIAAPVGTMVSVRPNNASTIYWCVKVINGGAGTQLNWLGIRRQAAGIVDVGDFTDNDIGI